MATIYDIDELQKENAKLKEKLQHLAQVLADCLHEDGGISYPKKVHCLYAKMVLEEMKND